MLLPKGSISCGQSLKKLCHLLGWLHENFGFSSIDFPKAWQTRQVIFSIGRAIVLWVISKHIAWIFIGNSLWNIIETHQNCCRTFWTKNYLFSDNSLPRLDVNTSIALQNMTESQKKKKKKKIRQYRNNQFLSKISWFH